MRLQMNSPIKVLGLLTILAGLAITVLTFGLAVMLGLVLIVIGLVFYGLDVFSFRLLHSKKSIWTAQAILMVIYVALVFIFLMPKKQQTIVFPNDYKGQAAIIFGIEGYPELPKGSFWGNTIAIPDNGILLTSTQWDDNSGKLEFAFTGTNSKEQKSVRWFARNDLNCKDAAHTVMSWIFIVDGQKGASLNSFKDQLCKHLSNK